MLYLLEALFVLFADIILPTTDTISDLVLILGVALTESGEHRAAAGWWAFFLLLPILVNISITW